MNNNNGAGQNKRKHWAVERDGKFLPIICQIHRPSTERPRADRPFPECMLEPCWHGVIALVVVRCCCVSGVDDGRCLYLIIIASSLLFCQSMEGVLISQFPTTS